MSNDFREEGQGKRDKACTIRNPDVTNFSFFFLLFLIRVKNDVPSRWWSSRRMLRFPLVPDTTYRRTLKLYSISVPFCITLVFYFFRSKMSNRRQRMIKRNITGEKKNVYIMCKNIIYLYDDQYKRKIMFLGL